MAQGAFRIAQVGVALISRLFQRRCEPPSAGLVSPRTNWSWRRPRGSPFLHSLTPLGRGS